MLLFVDRKCYSQCLSLAPLILSEYPECRFTVVATVEEVPAFLQAAAEDIARKLFETQWSRITRRLSPQLQGRLRGRPLFRFFRQSADVPALCRLHARPILLARKDARTAWRLVYSKKQVEDTDTDLQQRILANARSILQK